MMALDSFNLVKMIEQSMFSASGHLSFLPQLEEKRAGANAPQSGVKVVSGSARTRAVAQQSRASNTVLLGRSSEDCCLRKASSDFLRATDFRLVREGEPRTAAVQASACRLDPARNQFPYASCADFSGSGRLFRTHFFDFELEST